MADDNDEYLPSSWESVREQVATYERSGRTEGTTLVASKGGVPHHPAVAADPPYEQYQAATTRHIPVSVATRR